MKNNKRDELKNLLIKNYNLILTGAPGTGKTFLAREIAIAIAKDESRIGFCQFHPSFDYTDFVEGLRPTAPDDKGNIGFQRQDGIFKSFCAKAIRESSVNSQDNFDESWHKLVESLNDDNSVEIKNISGRGSFRVELNEYGTGLAKRTYETEEAQKRGEWISGQSRFFSKDQLYNIYRGLPGIPSGGHDNYRKAIIAYLKNNCGLREYKQGTRTENSDKRFVFIIDEINRGDISKIFGELFYAIDPGYRGDEGRRIQTQYANMLKNTGDIFEHGFYVPENIYIIGTMNDIDRSVESMDFAIRRRFSWRKIGADENTAMWNDAETGIPQYKDEAEKYMKRLNKAISDTDSLGEAFHIGPAYFLKLKKYDGSFSELWNWHIAPLLEEYLRGLPDSKEVLVRFANAYFDRQTEQSGNDQVASN